MSQSKLLKTYGRFTVQIKTLIGTSFPIVTYPSDDIQIIKGRIAIQESLDPSHQHLVYHSRELYDHEIAHQVGLCEGSVLTLVMTLRGGPVTMKNKSNLLCVGGLKDADDDLFSDQLEIVLVKCDGTIYIYQLAADSDDDDEDDLTDSDDEECRQPLITRQQVIENCKTRAQMLRLQKKMSKSRQRKRNDLMKQQRASLATARRRIPSPKRPPPTMSSRQQMHQFPKTAGYTTANNTINLLKAEIYLQSKRCTHPGRPPYSLTQLDRYVKSKLLVLLEDEGYQRSFVPRAYPLTPTVLTKEMSSSSSDEDIIEEIGELMIDSDVEELFQSHQPIEIQMEPPTSTYDLQLDDNFDESVDEDDTEDEDDALMESIKNAFNRARMKSARFRSARRKAATDEQIKEKAPNDEVPSASTPLKNKLDPVTAVAPGSSKNQETKASTCKRCGQCNKKLSVVNEYECRCGKFFCSKHRHAEAHECTFDYKEEGRRLIEKANPVVTAPKLPQI